MNRTVTEPWVDERAKRTWTVTVRDGNAVENLRFGSSEGEKEATAFRQKLINQGYEPTR